MPVNLLLTAALALAAPASADNGVKCAAVRQAKTIKILYMQPRRKDKAWLPGLPKSVISIACDINGLKIEEAEYDAKAMRSKSYFVLKSKDQALELCAALTSGAKPENSFSAAATSALGEFCARNLKNNFEATLVYDQPLPNSPDGSETPVLTHHIFRLYNANGNVTEEPVFDPTGNLETRTIYSYDSDNNLIETSVMDFSDRQLSRETLTYDKKAGSRTLTVYGEADLPGEGILYENRADGTLKHETRISYDTGGQVLDRSEIYCDNKGNYQLEMVYDADCQEPAREFTYEYTFDKQGNWLQQRKDRIIVYNGNRMADTQTAPEITMREIQYHKTAGAK